MSKMTDPINESTLSCGFFNSYNGDRKYDARQIASMFDGIINDGIFQNIGDSFKVRAVGGTTVKVGSGKAWFNCTWTVNDGDFVIDGVEYNGEFGVSTAYGIVFLEVNTKEEYRDNFIRYSISKLGVSDQTRKNDYLNKYYPRVEDRSGIYLYPLAVIVLNANKNEILNSDIYDTRGGSSVTDMYTPFVTPVTETMDSAELLTQWDEQFKEFMSDNTKNHDRWFDGETDKFSEWSSSEKQKQSTWMDQEKATILDWFSEVRIVLGSAEVAANLKNQIDTTEVARCLKTGLNDGTTTYSDDGRIVTSRDGAGKTLVKTFSEDFSECSIVLTDRNGGELGKLAKKFNQDGSVSSTMSIYGV